MAAAYFTRAGLSASTRAISIRQPWAARILAGQKSVEFRTWATRYRGLLIIHAPRTGECSNHPRGGLVGVVTLVDIKAKPGVYKWELENPRALSRLIPCKGRLGLFHLSPRLLNLLASRLQTNGRVDTSETRNFGFIHGAVHNPKKEKRIK